MVRQMSCKDFLKKVVHLSGQLFFIIIFVSRSFQKQTGQSVGAEIKDCVHISVADGYKVFSAADDVFQK